MPRRLRAWPFSITGTVHRLRGLGTGCRRGCLRRSGYARHETMSTKRKQMRGRLSAGRLDRLHGQKLYRQLDQRARTVRNLADELHCVAWLEQIPRRSVEVLDPPRDHVDQLGTRVLVEGKRLGPLSERDEQRLKRVVRRAHRAK